MRLLKMAIAQSAISMVQISLTVSPSIDLGGVYRAVFSNGVTNVELIVVGTGSASGEIPVGGGVISVNVQKTSSPATDFSSVSIDATNPTYSKSDTFVISETISLATDPGDISGCSSSTTIDVTLSEG